MGKNIGKNISKNLSGKYSQKRFDHAKKSATNCSKRVIQKIAEATADKITKVSKNLQQNNSETVTNDHDKEIPLRKIYISRRKARNY